MLTFKQYLIEMSWDKYVYHMTTSKFNPQKLHPWSHVGSLRAAMGIGNDSWRPRRGKPYIHAYKAPTGKGIEVKDNGMDPQDQLDDIIHQLIKKKVIPEPRGYKWKRHRGDEYFDWTWQDYVHVTDEWDDDRKISYIEKYLKKKGITHLYYKNTVEDPGTRSFIIFHPEKTLKPVHTFKGPFKYKQRYTDFTDSLSTSFGSTKRKAKFPLRKSPTTSEFPYSHAAEKRGRGRYWNVKEAQRLRNQGWTYKLLARKYGVTISAVWAALNG